MVKLKKKKIFLLCGIPGSGKSTWVKKNVWGDNAKIISRDEIRFSLLSDDDEYFEREHLVWKMYVKQANEAILNDNIEDIILDATHLNEKSRSKIMKEIIENAKKKDCGIYTITMIVPLDIAQERNSHRTGRSHVPENVIENMALSFTLPKKEEGFDETFYVIPEEIYENLLMEGIGRNE